MNLWLGLLIGLKEIWAHKFRSFLTMLGVILGVASLLSMFALTAGLAKGMREFMQQIGGIERVSIIPQEVPPKQEALWELSPGRTVADAEAISHSPFVSYVTPISQLPAAVQRGANTFRAEINGCWPDYVPINKHVVAAGRNLCALDLDLGLRVCVVGRLVADKLWPERLKYDPVGETIKINDRPFKIVGVFEYYEREEDKRRRELGLDKVADAAKGPRAPRPPGGGGMGRGWGPFDRKNSTIIMPITTMFWEFKSANVTAGIDAGPTYKLDGLNFQIADITRFDDALDQVRNIVLNTHRGIEDFGFDTRQDWFDTIEKNISNTRISFGFIAGISLLVGGIGITNIMLASITERIREIGVRRAIGAKGRDIFIQIVVESTVIGFIGGILGLAASNGFLKIIAFFSPPENAPVIDLRSVVISFCFAVVIGLLSGLYPAFRASRLDPIEALRYG